MACGVAVAERALPTLQNKVPGTQQDGYRTKYQRKTEWFFAEISRYSGTHLVGMLGTGYLVLWSGLIHVHQVELYTSSAQRFPAYP